MTWTLSKTLRHLLHSRAHLPGFLPLAPSSSSLSPHPTAGMICYELISILRKICVVLYHRHQLVCFTSSLPPSILHCSLFPPSLATRTLGLASRKVVISRNNLTPRAHVTADCLACLLQLSVLMCVARLQQRKSATVNFKRQTGVGQMCHTSPPPLPPAAAAAWHFQHRGCRGHRNRAWRQEVHDKTDRSTSSGDMAFSSDRMKHMKQTFAYFLP